MINFSLITQNKIFYKEEISKAVLPSYTGEITILKNHIPLISILKRGKIKITKTDKSEEKVFEIERGIIRFVNNNLIVLADLKNVE